MVGQDRIGQIADEVVASYYDFIREGGMSPHWVGCGDTTMGSYRHYTLPTRPPLKHPDLAFALHLSQVDAHHLDEDSLRERFHWQMRKLDRKPEAERYRVKDSLNG